jgi:hypothetical protein
MFLRRTPLNFLAAVFFTAGFFTAMNSPEVLLRLVQAVTPAEPCLKLGALLDRALARVVTDRFVYAIAPPLMRVGFLPLFGIGRVIARLLFLLRGPFPGLVGLLERASSVLTGIVGASLIRHLRTFKSQWSSQFRP